MLRIKIKGLGSFKKDLDKAIQDLYKEAIITLQRIGEDYVATARGRGDYEDRTSNLRNAHSYRIYFNGQIVGENIGETPEGANPSPAMFEENKTGKGLEMIVGDGMNYASFVEGKGFDVTASGFLKVERMVNEFNAK